MKKITSVQEFHDQIGQDSLTVMIFTTTWCPDCRRLEVFIDDIIKDHQDKSWFEIDSDDFKEIAQANEVMGIPSLLVYKNGEKLAHLHSRYAKTPEQVREYLDSLPEA